MKMKKYKLLFALLSFGLMSAQNNIEKKVQCTSDLGTYGEEEESVPLHVFEDVLQFVRRRYDQEPEGCDAGDPAMVDVVQRVQKEEEERSAENNARFGQQHGVPDRILVL